MHKDVITLLLDVILSLLNIPGVPCFQGSQLSYMRLSSQHQWAHGSLDQWWARCLQQVISIEIQDMDLQRVSY